MDSSESSHPASASISNSRSLTPSTSNSGSHDSDDMSLSSSHPPSNSATSSTSTPPETQSSGTMNTTTPEEQQEEYQMDTTSDHDSTPIQEQMNEIESPTGNEHVEDDQSNSENQRGAEEIGLLTDLYAFYNRESHYSSIPKGNDTMHMQEFYDRQVQVYHAYATDQEVDDKLNELYENYIKVVENKVEFPTDPIDIQIFRQSSWVWDDAHIGDSEDSSKQENAGVNDDDDDDVMKEPKDLPNQETGDDHDADMIKDSKDLPKNETGDVDIKDSEDVDHKDDDKAGGSNSAT